MEGGLNLVFSKAESRCRSVRLLSSTRTPYLIHARGGIIIGSIDMMLIRRSSRQPDDIQYNTAKFEMVTAMCVDLCDSE